METEKAIIEAAIKELREHEVYDYLTLIEESQIIKAMINFSRAQSTSLLNQIEALKKENERARELISEARSQIKYLHGRSETTGSGEAVIARCESFLNEQKPEA